MCPLRTATLLAIFFAIPAARADTTFAVRPELGVQAGYETFELGYELPQTSGGAVYEVSSELTYPLSATMAGGAFSLDAGSIAWFGSAHTNLHDPWGEMVDSDFITARSGTASRKIEFSHTQSRNDARLWTAEMALGVRIAQLSSTRLLMLFGFRHESMSHRVHGANGWQLDASGRQVPVSLPSETLGIEYDTRYRLPFVGARLDGALGPKTFFAAEVRLLSSFSIHEDDHVLRHKRATAKPFGLGFALNLAPSYRVTESFHVGLNAQLQYLHAVTGMLSQQYYADDPFIDGDQTRTTIPDSDFSFAYLRATILAFGELRF